MVFERNSIYPKIVKSEKYKKYKTMFFMTLIIFSNIKIKKNDIFKEQFVFDRLSV